MSQTSAIIETEAFMGFQAVAQDLEISTVDLFNAIGRLLYEEPDGDLAEAIKIFVGHVEEVARIAESEMDPEALADLARDTREWMDEA